MSTGSSGGAGESVGEATGAGGSGGTGGEFGVGGAGGAPDIHEPTGISLFIEVMDSTGAPLPNAAIAFQGSLVAADGAGKLLLEDLSSGRFVARVEAYGFAPASLAVELPPGAHAGAQVRLLPLGPPIGFDSQVGATLDVGGARVTIPQDAFVDENGDPVTGMVEATIVPLNPTVASLASLPGPLEGIDGANGDIVGLESVFMAEVSLWKDGNRLGFAPGVTAELELTLPDALAAQYSAGDTIPAWWLDLDAGYWKEEGLGTIAPSSMDPNKLAWFVEVEHFTWWNCDVPWTGKHCFDVHAVDTNGAAAPWVTITSNGVSYTGASTPKTTASDGHACVEIKSNGDAIITAGVPNAPLATVMVTGSGPPGSCSGQGASCAPLVVTIPPAQVCSPGAWQPCAYTGPPGTEGVGLCRAGRNYCNSAGTDWIGCAGEVLPLSETCLSPFDEDCDGEENEEGEGCACDPGSLAVCYAGPPATLGVGLCQAGLRECKPTGKAYGPCTGDILPQPETCATPDDDDCNGSTECGFSKGFGDANEQESSSITVDATGNSIITGWFKGTVSFGGAPLVSMGQDDIFVAKFDSSGNHLWSKRFGDAETQRGNSVAVDNAGNIVLAGAFKGTLDFGANVLASVAYTPFVAKLDASGQHVWSIPLTSDMATPQAHAVAVDGAGSVLVAGNYPYNVSFGPFGSVGCYTGVNNIFLVKFTSGGQVMWHQCIGDSADQYVYTMAVSGAGDICLAGNIHYWGGPVASLMKYDASGQSQGVSWVSGGGWHVGRSIAVDSQGNCFLTGGFDGMPDFGSGPLVSAGGGDVFVAKFGTGGQQSWSQRFGDASNQGGTGIALDSAGDVFVTGQFSGTVDFGGGPLVSAGGPDVFVAKFDAIGQHLWSKRFGGAGNDLVTAIAADSAANVLLTGNFDGSLSFGGSSLQTMGGYDIFLAKLPP